MSLPRTRLIVGCGALAGLVFAGWLIGDWGGSRVTQIVDDAGLLFFSLYAAAGAALAAGRGRGRQRAAWASLAVGLGCWALGEAIWWYYELSAGLRQAPFPSPADACFLIFPLGAGLALVLLPTGHSGQSPARLLLDGVSVAGSLFVVSWVTVLGSVYRAGATSHLALNVSLAYPVADLVTITMTVLVLARAHTAQRVALGLLAAGIVLMAMADSAFVYLNALGTYYSGNLIDLGWATAFLVLGAAAIAGTRHSGVENQRAQVSARVRLWLPYVPLLLAGGAAAVRFLPGLNAGPLPGVALILVVCVLARQFIVITENRSLLVAVAEQAFHDPLTGLANRALFTDRLIHAVHLQQRDLRPVAVLGIDLDDFKLVNDRLGHPAGDALLVRVAERLRGCLRTADTIARLGGDEFAILIEHGADQPLEIAHRVAAAFDAAFLIDGHRLQVRASIGLATASPDEAGVSPDGLLKQADMAMYAAKRDKASGVHSFTPDMHLADLDEQRLRDDLSDALGSTHLYVAYQPIVDVAGGAIHGVEALARWDHPDHGPIPPARFIAIAEEAGLIGELGRQILDRALAEFRTWPRSRAAVSLFLAVNVSAQQLADPEFPGQVLNLLHHHHVAGDQLVLEISEAVLATHVDRAADVAAALEKSGVRLAVDAFGSTASPLAHLSRFRCRLLKVDKAFIARLDTDPGALALFAALQQFGRSLDLKVVAKGVERPTQLAELRSLRCDLAQGYHFSRPVDSATIREALQAQPGPGARDLQGASS